MKKNNWFKENWIFVAILAVFLTAKIILLTTYNSLFFDEYEYIGIAKFIYSLGQTGFYSEMRPILFPLLLGVGWKLNIPIVLFGRMIALTFAIGALSMTYMLSKKFFNKNTAIWSVLLLASFPLFFAFSHRLLTGIPAVFLLLTSIYFFKEEKYGLCGLFAGLAFMIRFPSGLMLIPLLIFMIFKVAKIRKIIKFIIFYSIPASLFFIFNIFFYRDVTANFFDSMIRPFIIANADITRYNIAIYSQPFYYYFVQFFLNNWIFILLIAFVFFYFKNKLHEDFSFDLFVTAAIFLTVYFSWLSHKEFRYGLLFLPFITIMVAHSLDELMFFIKRKSKWISNLLVFAVVVFILVNSFILGYGFLGKMDTAHTNLCSFFSSYDEEYSLFSTTAIVVPCTDQKFYGRYFDLPTSVDLFLNESSSYNLFVFSSSTFPCVDEECEVMKREEFNRLSDSSELLYNTSSVFEYFAVFKK